MKTLLKIVIFKNIFFPGGSSFGAMSGLVIVKYEDLLAGADLTSEARPAADALSTVLRLVTFLHPFQR